MPGRERRRYMDREALVADWRAAAAEIERCDQGLDYADDPAWAEYWIRRRRAAEEFRRATWALLVAMRDEQRRASWQHIRTMLGERR
jgi:hypothetical protein